MIDFGILGVGDPACDYAMAWTFFNSQGREVFLKGLSQAMRNQALKFRNSSVIPVTQWNGNLKDIGV